MFFKQNKARAYYDTWIKKIIDEDNALDIEKHIIKHANELTTPNRNPENWAASMQNLLDIYTAKYDAHVDVALQLDKLQNHFKNNPETRIPPPGGSIPEHIPTRSTPKYNRS